MPRKKGRKGVDNGPQGRRGHRPRRRGNSHQPVYEQPTASGARLPRDHLLPTALPPLGAAPPSVAASATHPSPLPLPLPPPLQDGSEDEQGVLRIGGVVLKLDQQGHVLSRQRKGDRRRQVRSREPWWWPRAGGLRRSRAMT